MAGGWGGRVLRIPVGYCVGGERRERDLSGYGWVAMLAFRFRWKGGDAGLITRFVDEAVAMLVGISIDERSESGLRDILRASVNSKERGGGGAPGGGKGRGGGGGGPSIGV